MTGPEDTSADQWPSDQGPADYGLGDEPRVDVPAGLLGQAVELLDLCDELLNRPGHRLLDAKVSAVISRYQRANAETLRWFHDGLAITAAELHELLHDRGITVDPTLRGRPGPHYR
jgi:hypothetical protein